MLGQNDQYTVFRDQSKLPPERRVKPTAALVIAPGIRDAIPPQEAAFWLSAGYVVYDRLTGSFIFPMFRHL